LVIDPKSGTSVGAEPGGSAAPALSGHQRRTHTERATVLARTQTSLGDYRQDGALREMTLAWPEFIRRLSLHILPPGFTKIRHYGFLGNNRRAQQVPRAHQRNPPPVHGAAATNCCASDVLRRPGVLPGCAQETPAPGSAPEHRPRSKTVPETHDEPHSP